MLTRSRLYTLVLTACVSGYMWLFFIRAGHPVLNSSACLIKRITTIPCPSCGTTRAVMALLNGRLSDSLLVNPAGSIVAAIMLLGPVWILYDYATQGQSFYRAYHQLEAMVKKPAVAFSLIGLVLVNWFWNIAKGL